MLEKRKHPRLKEYDYSKNGCYFVTICVKKRKQILSTINTIVRSLKSRITKELGFSIWQD